MLKYSQIPALFLLIIHVAVDVNSSGISKWTEEAFCPDNYFVDGISLVFKNSEAKMSENPGIRTRNVGTKVRQNRPNSIARMMPENFKPEVFYGLNVSCLSVLDGEHTYFEEIPAFELSSEPASNFISDAAVICPQSDNNENVRLYGMVVGMEKLFKENNRGGGKLLSETSLYCNYENEAIRVDSNRSEEIDRSQWTQPDFCPWGKYICGVNLKYDMTGYEVLDVNFSCCSLFQQTFGWANYRGATKGGIIQSIPQIAQDNLQELIRNETHYQTKLDDPYYLGWKFCPMETYVTGIQGQMGKGQFRLSCSDMSKPKPRKPLYIQMEAQNPIWEMDDELSKHNECEGVATGFQILYEQIDKQIQGIRMMCSPDLETNDDLQYLKVILPKENTSDKNYSWGKLQMCKTGQVLCGFTTKSKSDENGNLLAIEHIKAKCCTVPETAEICSPYDDYELIAECDAKSALADMTCEYTLSEGLSSAEFPTPALEKADNIRQSLNKERQVYVFKNRQDATEDTEGSSQGYFTVAEETEKRNDTTCTETPVELEDVVSVKGLKPNFQRTFSSIAPKGESENSLSGTNSDANSQVDVFSTGFDWSRASGGTWNAEKSNQITFTVPAGLKTRIYQAVGYCANFQVRTNSLKRVDEIGE